MPDHVYDVTLRWNGTTADGYCSYSRNHLVGPAGLETEVTADPAFLGDPSRLNPEQLLVMAASSCQLLSFLAVAANAGIEVLDYTDDARGTMSKRDQPMRITTITLRPRVTVAAGTDPAEVVRLLERGHEECFIARSVTSQIVLDPTVVVLDG
ncbi:MAG: OsmC family protein, partial [Intrasporangium sp.]|uniref:OsmC family protein n=1 Tax=Intrasporangium sp. TaxID=1925024 RepID=UPI003F807D51